MLSCATQSVQIGPSRVSKHSNGVRRKIANYDKEQLRVADMREALIFSSLGRYRTLLIFSPSSRLLTRLSKWVSLVHCVISQAVNLTMPLAHIKSKVKRSPLKIMAPMTASTIPASTSTKAQKCAQLITASLGLTICSAGMSMVLLNGAGCTTGYRGINQAIGAT